jgi:hypothetical protein
MTEKESVRHVKRTRRGEWSKKPESDINKHFAERDILKDAADKSRVTKRKTRIRSDVSVEEKEQKWIMIRVTRESMNMSGKKWHFVQAIGLCILRRLFSRLYEVTEHEDNTTVVYYVFWYSNTSWPTKRLYYIWHEKTAQRSLRWLRGLWHTCRSTRTFGSRIQPLSCTSDFSVMKKCIRCFLLVLKTYAYIQYYRI